MKCPHCRGTGAYFRPVAPEREVLAALRRAGRASSFEDLTHALPALSVPALYVALRRLEAAGEVRRVVDPSDRRRNLYGAAKGAR